jgi:hypothetical protein
MEHSPFWAAAALAEFVRDQASWRRTQAQRFPDDARNAQSADALEQLAMHVEALPDTDRHLIELIELDAFDDASYFTGGDEARRAIARWGFGDATSHMRPRDLLQDLVAITRRARRAKTPAHERKTEMTVAVHAALHDHAAEAARRYVDDIFTLALYHDRDTEEIRERVSDLTASDEVGGGLTLTAKGRASLEDSIEALKFAIADLCATLAPVALRRATALVAAGGGHTDILVPDSDEANAYARHLFEAAGIADRYVAATPRAWSSGPTRASLDAAETEIEAFLAEPNARTLGAALEAIEDIGPAPDGTTVDWEASKQILRRTIKAAGQPRGSTYAASIEAPNLLRLFREDVERHSAKGQSLAFSDDES